MNFETIRHAIDTDVSNAAFAEQGPRSLFVADPRARIAIIGQAPGQKAQASGIPWDDASGARLMDWLGVREEQFRDPSLFAMLPMDFYYPGRGARGDLPPRKGFATRWHPLILSELPELRLALLIGAYAQNEYLSRDRKTNLTETVRSYREYLPRVFPLAHPSPLNFRWQARNPWFETELIPDLRAAVAAAVTTSD